MRKISTFMAVGALSLAAFACGTQADVAAPVKDGAQAAERAITTNPMLATARVCVRHPRGVEAIPSVGPAITARQCYPPATR